MPEDAKQNAYADDGYMVGGEDFLSNVESLLSNTEDLMPSEEFEKIEEPVWQMQESIHNFQEAEKLEGPQPEIWEAFQPHQQQIVDNMRNMNVSYYQSKPEKIRQEARQHTTEFVQQADKFFQTAYQKLMKQSLFHFLGSQGVTNKMVVQDCTAWKNTADKYLQEKGLVAEKEESKKR